VWTGLPLQCFAFAPIAALAVIGLLLGYKNIYKQTRQFWLLFLWLGYAGMTTIWSPDRLRGIMFIGTMLCGFFCIRIFMSPALEKKVYQGFIAGVTVMNLFMIMLYVQNSGIVDIVYTRFAYLIGGLDVNPNMWGFYQILTIVMIFSWIIKNGANFQAYMLLGYHTWMLWMTGSRGSIISFFIILIFSVILFKQRLKLIAVSSVFFVALAMALLLPVLISHGTPGAPSSPGTPGLPPSRVVSVDLFDGNGREDIWKGSFIKYFGSPLVMTFGIGNGGADVFTGQAISEYTPYILEAMKTTSISPHSLYFSFLFEYGIPGFLLFCAVAVHIIYLLWKRSRSMIMFIIPSIVVGTVSSIHTSPPFILALAIILAHIYAAPIADNDKQQAESEVIAV